MGNTNDNDDIVLRALRQLPDATTTDVWDYLRGQKDEPYLSLEQIRLSLKRIASRGLAVDVERRRAKGAPRRGKTSRTYRATRR